MTITEIDVSLTCVTVTPAKKKLRLGALPALVIGSKVDLKRVRSAEEHGRRAGLAIVVG